MGTVNIAHISDLHFGATGQLACWKILRDHLAEQIDKKNLHLVLITGDIADSPKKKFLSLAQKELNTLERPPDTRYLVCPGNHDRHFHGLSLRTIRFVNSIAEWFSRAFSFYFEGKIPTLQNPISVALTDGDDKWNLRVLGVDSSFHADYLARGYFDRDERERLDSAMTNSSDVDLSILLCHHHLLPVRLLEHDAAVKGLNVNDIGRFTILVNAGRAMEQLANSHVDLVLHGHEHAANWGRYGTLEIAGGETAIIGAASGTGTVTAQPCDSGRISYNLLSLYPDRSANLFVMTYADGGFKKAAEYRLLSAEGMRKQRFLRQLKAENRVNFGEEVVKVVEFTRKGDGIVNQYHTGYRLDQSREWVLRARNATGTPKSLKVSFVAPDEERFDPQPDPLFKRLGVDFAWEARCALTAPYFERHKGETFQVEESYIWEGGAVISAAQMNHLRQTTDAGPLRCDGKEFAAISIKDWFASATLLVRIDPAVAPDPNTVEAWVFDNKDPLTPQAARGDISDGVRILGQGLYSLIVRYPRKDYRYCLSWEPRA
jgi:3',5'-cyclic AMP phosphodiesterase CpdA